MLAAGGLGCLNCHGPGGTGGVANPGAEEGTVPGWTGGALAMYANGDAEVREWIKEGITGRQRDADAKEPPAKDLIAMPAFGRMVPAGGIADLASYVEAVAGWPRTSSPRVPSSSALVARGRKVAASLACFGCHGPGGLTGEPNPRSFKGEIPPWTGADFHELVRNDDELRSWIRDGGIPRFESNPLVRWVINRQAIHMPAYGDRIPPRDLEALIAYIRAL